MSKGIFDCAGQETVPNVFLMSILLFLGTFLISVQLKEFKNALFFPSKVSMLDKLDVNFLFI